MNRGLFAGAVGGRLGFCGLFGWVAGKTRDFWVLTQESWVIRGVVEPGLRRSGLALARRRGRVAQLSSRVRAKKKGWSRWREVIIPITSPGPSLRKWSMMGWWS